MKQQTAVEWLTDQLPTYGYNVVKVYPELFEQAKQMEKEQIIDAYKRESVYMKHAGCTDEMIDKNSIKYYKETYGNK